MRNRRSLVATRTEPFYPVTVCPDSSLKLERRNPWKCLWPCENPLHRAVQTIPLRVEAGGMPCYNRMESGGILLFATDGFVTSPGDNRSNRAR